jgi:outer membrane cobalamin receptor
MHHVSLALAHYATLLVMLACVFSSATLSAQTAAIEGRVTDSQGGAIVDAVVTFSAAAPANQRTARTGADGRFTFTNVPAGPYTLRVEAPNFQPATQNFTLGHSAQSVDVVLQVAGVTEDVVVAAPKLEEELPQQIERQGVRIQTITGAQIENGGYDDVGQALQAMVPGLYLTPKAGAFDYVTMSLQGSRTNEILWLVDGVRISNRLYNGTTPLDTLPAHMIERIEVIEGGQGLFYGTQAVAGVINIVTKSFTETASGRLQTSFDTNKGRHFNMFARDSGRGGRFVFFGSSDIADGYRSFPEGEFSASTTDRNRSYDVLLFGGKYAYEFTPALRFSASYQRSGVSLDNLRPARSSAGQAGGLAASFNDRTEHITSAKLDYTSSETAQYFFKFYHHVWDSFFNESRNFLANPGGSEEVISDDEFWGFKDYGANVLGRFAPNRGFEYFAGYDFQNYSGRDDVLLIADKSETVHAIFGQVRTTRDLMPRGTVSVGARFNAPTNSQKATVWNVSGQYDIASGVYARGTVGTAFRYPDAYELFAIDPTCCFGNPNLKPETSSNVNGSVGGRVPAGETSVNLEAIGFFRRVTDLIIDTDDGSGETTMTANSPNRVKVYGLSFVGSSALTSAFSASLAYTYNKSQQNELAGGYDAILGIPSNQFEAVFDVHPVTMPFGLGLTVNTIGKITDSVSGIGNVASGDYTIVDLSGRVFLDSSRRHRLNMRLENLFDEEYSTTFRRNYTDSGTPFLAHYLGTPATFHISYSFSY